MSKEDHQIKLFDSKEWWEEHWNGMPEFNQNDEGPYKTIILHFKDREDMLEFAKLIKQTVTTQTQSIWYPEAKIRKYSNKRYIDS